ncbi:unnamed protein product, partial [Laminaria digitata]
VGGSGGGGSGSGSGSGSGRAAGGPEAGGAKPSGSAPGDGGDNNSSRDGTPAGKASGDGSREGERAEQATVDGETANQSGGVGNPRGGVHPGTRKEGDGGSVVGHYGPMTSAVEIKVADKAMAFVRRGAELASKPAGTYAKAGPRGTPVQRIMREYAGPGPYSLLYRLHEEKRRASVMIRRVNSVRGTCTGLIRAFDRHMNLLLADVKEEYTVLVPDRPPKPLSSENVQRTGAEETPAEKTTGTPETGGVGADATHSSLSSVKEGGFGAAVSSWTLVEPRAA